MTAALLLLLALLTEIAVGWPHWLFTRIRHPVVWIGALINVLERTLNRKSASNAAKYCSGMLTGIIVVTIVTTIAHWISKALPNVRWAFVLEIAIAASLIAARSLYVHVAAVQKPLGEGDVSVARAAVKHIVGRDASLLDAPAVGRASLESLAENASDGVIAPLFWGAILGLPGIAAYKAINTLDSMIGHRTERYLWFGRFSARLDDLVNLIPARVTALMIVLVSGKRSNVVALINGARSHRSPNAGWPESALAFSLGVRLSGPRRYGDVDLNEPWINAQARDPDANSLAEALHLYIRVVGLAVAILATIAALQYF